MVGPWVRRRSQAVLSLISHGKGQASCSCAHTCHSQHPPGPFAWLLLLCAAAGCSSRLCNCIGGLACCWRDLQVGQSMSDRPGCSKEKGLGQHDKCMLGAWWPGPCGACECLQLLACMHRAGGLPESPQMMNLP